MEETMDSKKTDSATMVVAQRGDCRAVDCISCFTTQKECGSQRLVSVSWKQRKLALANAYLEKYAGRELVKD